MLVDNYLTTEQTAARLKLHQNTVIRYIRDGRLPAKKVGNAYRIRESAVSALLGEEQVRPNDSAWVIAVANAKGGVAKTTTAVNLASCLATSGKRVLLVDFDPQGGCSVCLGMDTTALQRTVYDFLVGRTPDLSKILIKTKHGFDLAPSNIDLSGAEVELKKMLAQESVLKRRLESVQDAYDIIIIDTPPSFGILTVNALTAAHSVLVPVSCDLMALRGLRMLLDTVVDVRTVTNPSLQILGIVATKFDSRTLNSRDVYGYLETLCEREGIRLFNHVIKQSVRVAEAPNSGVPIVDLIPDLDASQAYRQIAQEIIHG